MLNTEEIERARRKLTPHQRKVFDKLDVLGKGEPDGISPTALGVAMGWAYKNASAQSGKYLKALIDAKLVRRVDFGKGRVLYRTVKHDAGIGG